LQGAADASNVAGTPFSRGLELYKQREWEQAIQAFHVGVDSPQTDGPTAIYIERCKAFLDSPPPEDWDGVFDITTK
jgi:adenylate cyclase